MNTNESNIPSGEVPEETPEQKQMSEQLQAMAKSVEESSPENPYSTQEGGREMQRKKLEDSGEWEANGKVSFERFDGDIKKGLEFLFGEDMLQATPEQIADELILQANNERANVPSQVRMLAMYLGVDNLFSPIWDRGQGLFGNEKEKIVQALQKSVETQKRASAFKSESAKTVSVPASEKIDKKPELSEVDIENADNFINTFVANNEGLTPEAKEMLTDKAKSQRGAWSVKGFVQEVKQEGKRVTIKTKSGESFLQLK